MKRTAMDNAMRSGVVVLGSLAFGYLSLQLGFKPFLDRAEEFERSLQSPPQQQQLQGAKIWIQPEKLAKFFMMNQKVGGKIVTRRGGSRKGRDLGSQWLRKVEPCLIPIRAVANIDEPLSNHSRFLFRSQL
ncbi:PREDICTED: uncharacterized protein LOC104818801 isoform X1 [Tarenaya hassleriana]|uniref:uncharacterized protein LOC104818801 isoform X1 n=1 Tax=Tarenaya hassleriana TaxID=28532 RepID=UPI00053C8075|nr:PREDICTED: uncharacterized protein LOC104818801 isoform X1 [Tarenaya hassleriana]